MAKSTIFILECSNFYFVIYDATPCVRARRWLRIPAIGQFKMTFNMAVNSFTAYGRPINTREFYHSAPVFMTMLPYRANTRSVPDASDSRRAIPATPSQPVASFSSFLGELSSVPVASPGQAMGLAQATSPPAPLMASTSLSAVVGPAQPKSRKRARDQQLTEGSSNIHASATTSGKYYDAIFQYFLRRC